MLQCYLPLPTSCRWHPPPRRARNSKAQLCLSRKGDSLDCPAPRHPPPPFFPFFLGFIFSNLASVGTDETEPVINFQFLHRSMLLHTKIQQQWQQCTSPHSSHHRQRVKVRLPHRRQVQVESLLPPGGRRYRHQFHQQPPQVPARRRAGRRRGQGSQPLRGASISHESSSDQRPAGCAAPRAHRRGHCVGPSTGEVVGSSCTSMNRPDTPHATAVECRVGKGAGGGGRAGGRAGGQAGCCGLEGRRLLPEACSTLLSAAQCARQPLPNSMVTAPTCPPQPPPLCPPHPPVRAMVGIMSRSPPLATPPPSSARPAGCKQHARAGHDFKPGRHKTTPYRLPRGSQPNQPPPPSSLQHPLPHPPPRPAPPRTCCSACVTSAVTGQPASRMATKLRGSTTRSL